MRTKRERLKAREEAQKRFLKQKWRNLAATPGVHPCILVLDHLKPNFNIGKIIRSADAFGVHEVHIVGTQWFDPVPAKGSFKWVPVRFHPDFAACYRALEERGYTFFTLEPDQGEPLPGADLPPLSAFVLGHEEYGISFKREDFSRVRGLSIPQFGRVQSLNVSIAASIVVYEYLRRHGAAGEASLGGTVEGSQGDAERPLLRSHAERGNEDEKSGSKGN